MLIIFQFFTPQFSTHTLDLSRNLAENAPLILFYGQTFAWFTSSDEVTNRLTAKGEYRVAVAETFTPPEDMVPGQEVNKDVTIVNTGNVDALVKVGLTGAFSMTYYGTDTTTAPTVATKANFKEYEEKDVKAVQAGAKLVKAPSGTYGDASTSAPIDIESFDETTPFTPDVTGTYIFQRTDGTYSGYYAVVTAGTPATVNYFALETTKTAATNGASTYLLGSGTTALTTAEVASYTPTYVTVKTATVTDPADATNDTATIEFSAVSNNALTATVKSKETGTPTLAVFTIKLDGDWGDAWQELGTATFFYKDDLAGGAETAQLVDAVEFTTANTVYTTLTFDLNVKATSVQTTKLADGTEVLPGATDKSADTTAAAVSDLGAKAQTAHASTDTDISSITWSAS